MSGDLHVVIDRHIGISNRDDLPYSFNIALNLVVFF